MLGKKNGAERSDMDGHYHSDIGGHPSSYRDGYGKPSWIAREQKMQGSRDRQSMSFKESGPSPAYLSPAMAFVTHPSYVHLRARTSTSDGQKCASNRSVQSPPPSFTTTFSSDPYSIDEHSLVSSPSSLRAPSQHFYRSQVRSSTELKLFNQLWDVMLEVRRHIERYQSKNSAEGPRPLPSIRDGDVATLTSHLLYEIDVLAEADGRSADHFALDVRHLHDQFSHRRQRMRARSSTVFMASNRDRSSFSHYQPHQQYHSFSSTFPPNHPKGPVSSSQMPQGTPLMPGGYSETPSSAPHTTRGQEMYFPAYNYHRPEYGMHGRETINQRVMELECRVSSGYATPMYDGRFITGPSSPQDDMRSMSSAHLGGPGTISYSHHGRISQAMPRRVRKRRDEAEQSCVSCSAEETPEWRKGPSGSRTLCNACGLLYAKECRKRDLDLQAHGKLRRGSQTGGGDDMTQEKRKNSLLELQIAVQARVIQSNPILWECQTAYTHPIQVTKPQMRSEAACSKYQINKSKPVNDHIRFYLH